MAPGSDELLVTGDSNHFDSRKAKAVITNMTTTYPADLANFRLINTMYSERIAMPISPSSSHEA